MSKLYNGENLYSYKMTIQEKLIVEIFRQELIDICNELDCPRCKCFPGSPYMRRLQDNYGFSIKYKEDIGYFILKGERSVFSMKNGFSPLNKEETKYTLLELEFDTGGHSYELKLRDKLKKEWSQKYNIQYDSRKAAFEYTIKMLETVYKCFPDSLITKYTNYMNRWFESKHWYFNKNKMSFEEL